MWDRLDQGRAGQGRSGFRISQATVCERVRSGSRISQGNVCERAEVYTCDKHGRIVDVRLVRPDQIRARSKFEDGADGQSV